MSCQVTIFFSGGKEGVFAAGWSIRMYVFYVYDNVCTVCTYSTVHLCMGMYVYLYVVGRWVAVGGILTNLLTNLLRESICESR